MNLVALLIPLVTVGFVVYVFAGWPSHYAVWVDQACDDLRGASVALAEGDRPGVEDRAYLSALDPASEQEDADQSEIQQLWAASEALRDVLRRWKDADADPPQLRPDEQGIVERGLETCEQYDLPWYSPHRLLGGY